jgi:hypothetical protein
MTVFHKSSKKKISGRVQPDVEKNGDAVLEPVNGAGLPDGVAESSRKISELQSSRRSRTHAARRRRQAVTR